MAAAFNKVMLMGNLTRDPQLKYLPSQTAVVEFGIAVNRRYRTSAGEDKEEVTFIDCTAFGGTAETINKWCQKGKSLFVEGRLHYEQWEDKQGGGRRSKLKVIVENFQFVGGRQSQDEGAGGNGEHEQTIDRSTDQTPTPRRQAPPSRPAPPAESPSGGEQKFDDDSIPF